MMVRVRQEEIDCLRRRNCVIRNTNQLLKCTLKNLSDNPFLECDKVLSSIIAVCKKKCEETPTAAPVGVCEKLTSPCPPPDRSCSPKCVRSPRGTTSKCPANCCCLKCICTSKIKSKETECPAFCCCLKCIRSPKTTTKKQECPEYCCCLKCIRSPKKATKKQECPEYCCCLKCIRSPKTTTKKQECPEYCCCLKCIRTPKKCPNVSECPEYCCCLKCSRSPKRNQEECPDPSCCGKCTDTPNKSYMSRCPKLCYPIAPPKACCPPSCPSSCPAFCRCLRCTPSSKGSGNCGKCPAKPDRCPKRGSSKPKKCATCCCLCCLDKVSQTPKCTSCYQKTFPSSCSSTFQVRGQGVCKPKPRPVSACTSPKPRKACCCCEPPECRCVPAICRDNSRLGAGCSKGGCGGYTPSGWNKLMTKCRLMQEQEAECTCTPCTPCPPKRKPRCKPNPCADASNSQGAPNDESEDKKKRPSLKILGELAFQLERRILDYVFGMEDTKRKRFYGYTVGNIFSMMERESKNPRGGSDAITKSELVCRLRKLMVGLEKYGYNIKFHAEFAQEIVNKYGLLACPPDQVTIEEFRLNDPLAISTLIQQLAQGPSEMSHLNVLLNSLVYLSNCDHRPLFIW